MFYNAKKLTSIPYVKGVNQVGTIRDIFHNADSLTGFPEDWADYIDFTSYNAGYSPTSHIFSGCSALRSIPTNLQRALINTITTGTSTGYYNRFYCCYALDEIVDLPVSAAVLTSSSAFTNCFDYCGRLKRVCFAMQEDGTPYTASWKTQTLNLSNYVGFSETINDVTKWENYHGITQDKHYGELYDNDPKYDALKNDADGFTTIPAYSRYNHDSAVETINSLPDTSAYLAEKGGTNTIRFKGAAGEYTDGGAINTLTEEEIAVATAKGWTVSYV